MFDNIKAYLSKEVIGSLLRSAIKLSAGAAGVGAIITANQVNALTSDLLALWTIGGGIYGIVSSVWAAKKAADSKKVASVIPAHIQAAIIASPETPKVVVVRGDTEEHETADLNLKVNHITEGTK